MLPVLYTTIERAKLKSHLHQSQINLLKALVEEIEGMKIVYKNADNYRQGSNDALSQVQELINKTIEEI